MAYYLRAFCAADVPPLREILEAAAARGSPLSLDAEQPADPDAASWSAAAIRYKPDRQPLRVEANRAGEGDDLLAEEVDEFLEQLEDAPDSADKERVATALRATRAVVAVALPNDVDDEGYDAAGALLQVFVATSGAIVQADGEGFYDGDRLIVELD